MSRITLDWLHVVALLGAMQGLLLAAVLALKPRNRTANRLLAAAVLTFTLYLVSAVYYAAGLVRVWPHFFGVSYPLPFLFGPLIYLYAVTASDRSRRLRRLDALHLLPFVLAVLFGLPIYLMSGADKIALFQALARGERPLALRIADPLKLLSGVAYATATLLFLRWHAERVKDSYSHLERVNLRWLLWLGAAAAAIWVLATCLQLAEALTGARVPWGDDVVVLAVAALVYAIGYMGLRQPEVCEFASADVMASPSEAVADARADAEAEAPRYERSGLSDWEAASLRKKLLALMDTADPWRNSELTLADLAAQLSTTPHKLSEVLNGHLGQTFYDFVNGYRVRAVQQRLAAGGKAPKLLALALDAGFASKSTFNDVFKKHTGQTPSAYRSVLRQPQTSEGSRRVRGQP